MSDLKAAREKTVRDHMRLENEGAWDDVISDAASGLTAPDRYL